MITDSLPNPKVFISYAWESTEHRDWILQISCRLQSDGVQVTLDQWDVVPGDQLPYFMEQAIINNDFILIFCTPTYKRKSDARKGGVGYEGDIMTAQVFVGGKRQKFIPLLRIGEWEAASPTWLVGSNYIDFRAGDSSEVNYQHLLDYLHNRLPKRPPLGGIPSVLDDLDLSVSTYLNAQLTGSSVPFSVKTEVFQGGNVSFLIYVSNSGNCIVERPRITVDLGDQFEYVPFSSHLRVKRNNINFEIDICDDEISLGDGSATWRFEDIAPAQDAGFFLIFQARVSLPNHFTQDINVFEVRANVHYQGGSEQTNYAVITVKRICETPQFSLSLEMANATLSPSKFYHSQRLIAIALGDRIRYKIISINTESTVEQVKIKMILPLGVDYLGNAKIYNNEFREGLDIDASSIVTDGFPLTYLEQGSINYQTIMFDAKITDVSPKDTELISQAILIHLEEPHQVSKQSALVSVRGVNIILLVAESSSIEPISLSKSVRRQDLRTLRIIIQNNTLDEICDPCIKVILPPFVHCVPKSLVVFGNNVDDISMQAFINEGIILSLLPPGYSNEIVVSLYLDMNMQWIIEPVKFLSECVYKSIQAFRRTIETKDRLLSHGIVSVFLSADHTVNTSSDSDITWTI